MMGAVTLDEQIKNGKARLEGNREPYDLFMVSLVQFSMGLEILPGTGSNNLPAAKDPFAQEPPAVQAISD